LAAVALAAQARLAQTRRTLPKVVIAQASVVIQRSSSD
jgi:hypothetical protein